MQFLIFTALLLTFQCSRFLFLCHYLSQVLLPSLQYISSYRSLSLPFFLKPLISSQLKSIPHSLFDTFFSLFSIRLFSHFCALILTPFSILRLFSLFNRVVIMAQSLLHTQINLLLAMIFRYLYLSMR